MNKVFFLLALFYALAHSGDTFAINKCTQNGQVTYTDSPCAQGTNSTIFSARVIAPEDPEGARRRYLSDKKELEKIQKQRMKEENLQRREEHRMAVEQKKNQERVFKCRELEFKRKSAQQHLAEAQSKGNFKQTHKAQSQLQLTTEKYAHFCEMR